MPADVHAARRRSLLKRMRAEGVEAMLVTDETNVTYLTGFTGDSSWLLASRGTTLLLSDGRYATQIQEECPGLDAHIRPTSEGLPKTAAAAVDKAVSKTGAAFGIEADSMTVAVLQSVGEACKRASPKATGGLVEALRAVKDVGEVNAIREAVAVAEAGFAYLRRRINPEALEIDLSNDLEHVMRQFGAVGHAFAAIIGVEDRAALPHYTPGRVRVDSASHVLVDWGARMPSGYVSDVTRTLVARRPGKKLSKVYEAVREANEAGIRAVRPGATGKEVDAAARGVLERHGLAKWFSHSLGHGIGLKVHEAPGLRPTGDAPLEAGMVVTVEPGVYLPGQIGVRIEDDVLVTPDGRETLTSLPKDIDAFSDSL